MNEKSRNSSSDTSNIKEEKELSDQNELREDINYKINKIVYPFEKIKSIPIITTSNKELCFLYFSENDYQFFSKEKNDFLYTYSYDESESKNIQLKHDILSHFQKLFNYMNLEKRIIISYSDKMINIKPNYSLAIEMNEDFKNRPFIKSQIRDYLFIKKDILKNLDFSKEKIISYDPFYSLRFNSIKNSEKKKLYPKFAVSLLKNNTELDEDDDDEEILNYRKSFYSNEIKDKAKSYKDIILQLFKINDFRIELINYCLENDKDFKNDDFERFICYLEYFITLFTGIQVKYSIDEIGLLNMDFYSNEDIFMDMAEILHYKVQFQIRDKSYTQGKKHKKISIIKLNNIQFENYDFDKIECFPVYTAFMSSLANNFRRYDEYDNYHLCKKCMNNLNSNQIPNIAPCPSSLFRFIDKTRLLYMTLLGVFNLGYIEKMIKLESNYINQVFKSSMFLRNESALNKINDNSIFLSYLSPIHTIQSKRLDNIFRNVFGESIGYFYTWISHYLTWLLFPTLVGLIVEVILFFGNEKINTIINIIFLSVMILWGFYYVEDWNCFQVFFNQIWGINVFKGEESNLYDDNYKKINYVTFLGLKMEKVNKFQKFINSFLSFLILLFCSAIIIVINIVVFYLYKMKDIRKKFYLIMFMYENLAQYQVPVLILFVREIISHYIFKISKYLANLENPTDKEKYMEIKTKKILILEYVNYYFNLYYIAFYKKIKGTCTKNNCSYELKNQLMMILITESIYVLGKLFYKLFFLKKSQKNFESQLMQKIRTSRRNVNDQRYFSIKFKIYTREEFVEEDIQKVIVPVIYDFGYVIQFGACYPISFLFLIILVILCRIVDAISMIILYYVKTIEVSKGLKKYNRMQNILLYIGIFTNLGIICYTKGKEFLDFNIIYSLTLVIAIENGILLIFKTFNFAHLPFWFRYKDNIQLKYLKKFGVAYINKIDKFNDAFLRKKK